jgi:hypothetical protein
MDEVLTLDFSLRGFDGRVRVSTEINDDPPRWGFELLGLEEEAVTAAHGHPVIQAEVEFSADGYAAELSWVQLVSHSAPDQPTRVFCDVPPHLADTGMPFMSLGVRPTFFDAPADTWPSSEWRATAFLAYTPDVLMTKVVGPLCGFRWGFDKVEGEPRIVPVERAEPDDWNAMADRLRALYPAWKFLPAE